MWVACVAIQDFPSVLTDFFMFFLFSLDMKEKGHHFK